MNIFGEKERVQDRARTETVRDYGYDDRDREDAFVKSYRDRMSYDRADYRRDDVAERGCSLFDRTSAPDYREDYRDERQGGYGPDYRDDYAYGYRASYAPDRRSDYREDRRYDGYYADSRGDRREDEGYLDREEQPVERYERSDYSFYRDEYDDRDERREEPMFAPIEAPSTAKSRRTIKNARSKFLIAVYFLLVGLIASLVITNVVMFNGESVVEAETPALVYDSELIKTVVYADGTTGSLTTDTLTGYEYDTTTNWFDDFCDWLTGSSN